MFLAQMTIRNFRRVEEATFFFRPGLNVIVGPNNIGKTAAMDALRALLAGTDDPYPRFNSGDIHQPIGGLPTGDIRFEYVFQDLTLDEEADFLHALREAPNGKIEAVMGVVYGEPDKSGRLKPKRWCGKFDELSMTFSMLENLRSVYLQPLRDAELSLRPSRNSQLSRLIHLLSDEPGRTEIAQALKELDDKLKKYKPIQDTYNAISGRHKTMLGPKLAQAVDVGLAGTDFDKLAARLSLVIDSFDIERNGLGYNNLIFMAVVLSELAKNADASFRCLIVEEPEAHLHPQLQAILLRYLSSIDKGDPGERPVQVFVTSHSPNFASIADLDSIACMIDATAGKATVFHPRTVNFAKGKKEKLARYLDVTRSELFFARRALFVEGAAELLLISVLAELLGYDLRQHGVSLISVEGLNFDCFMPLFGEKAIPIPVSIITDADPTVVKDDKTIHLYPDSADIVEPSDTAKSMLSSQDALVKVFFGKKTFEYDLALIEKNRSTMLTALKDIHPLIGAALEKKVDETKGNREKAEALFRGMFERPQENVSKGKFAQALAAQIQDNKLDFESPEYIRKAIEHVSQ